MRLRIRHHLHYRFAEPVRNVTQILRMTPRSHEGQHIMNWRIDVDVDCMLKAGVDGFGNITHTFTAKGLSEELAISLFGEIENFDTAGLIRGSAERLPVDLFLRGSDLTTADEPLRRFAETAVAEETTDLGKLHALLDAVHVALPIAGESGDLKSASETFAAKTGTSGAVAHVFIACARHLGFPARFASGYYLGEEENGTSHAWSEAYVGGLGWIGFDAAHAICPQERHIRVASGLDGLAAAPVRGTYAAELTDRLDITTLFGFDGGQRQSQTQGGQSQSQGGQSQSQGSGGQSQSQG
ncbi:transglutaminase family protein [Lichenihabitans psoromatis]|uniref:transglutaminase family protein n=1 Tax=Lichenihabitans psoromatis TaxID=2528642 RepID=UPI00103609E8|nr:transglutaminase family protein [Lichenihabitans psoromatis]